NVNLTRITEPADVFEKHYIDSILPLTLYIVPRGTLTLDVGSGAGFPGIPMKMFRPDLRMTLVDSAKKRTDYLKAALREIGLDCAVITGRSERLAYEPDLREAFGFVTARAVASLPVLCEYCLPFVKVGGVFIAMKGANDEADLARDTARVLGAQIVEVKKYALSSGDRRSLVIMEKTARTPRAYPRKRMGSSERHG
ncbi:MAG: 16S rRNA (guanine(527)-N(7))-methyltransferase RsmG, partial [Oscillospiraceae bacterium]|nr:16S rRNA (guanine(527)-N(7))-methyltransferase RsmG [Oscillospiraceae bacterium]